MKQPTEAHINRAIDQYFKECEYKQEMPTKAGWMLKLEIYNRDTYNHWKEKSDALKKAELFMENIWNQYLKGNNVAGIIFYLKNAFGYRDSKEHIMDGEIKIQISNEQKQKIAKRIIGRGSNN